MVGECHAGPARLVDGSRMALWPRTMMEDVCGQWSGQAVAVRVADEAVMELIGEAISPPIRVGDERAQMVRDDVNDFLEEHGAPRVAKRWQAIELMGKRGIPPTTAMDRIRSLHRRGLIEMGPAPEIYRKKWGKPWKTVCVWMPKKGEARVAVPKVSKADLDPKWVAVREMLRSECPDEGRAKTFLELLELCRAVDPNTSHGGLQRFIKRRVADGHMAHGKEGYYLLNQGPDAPASPQPIEVD